MMNCLEPILSDYVMNQLTDQDQARNDILRTAMVQDAGSPPPNAPSSIPSQYVDLDLRSFITVNQNRVYQDYPSTIRRKPLIGHPISARELRKRVDTLEDAVYTPIIVNGTLYFVSMDDDTRTAKSSSDVDANKPASTATSANSVDMSDVAFTMKELKEILPQYAVEKLERYYKAECEEAYGTAPDRTALKLRNAISTLVQFMRSYSPSHLAVATILANTDDSEIIQLRNALNMIQPDRATPLSRSAYSSSTFFDTSTHSQSVTGDPFTSLTSTTTVSTAYTGAEDDYAESTAKPATKGESYEEARPRTKSLHTPAPWAMETAAVPSDSMSTAYSYGRILDDTMTARGDELLEKPELIVEWERPKYLPVWNYYGAIPRMSEASLSTETAMSVDNETLDRIRSEISMMSTALAKSCRTNVRVDSPEREAHTAFSIED
ncbi:hypothetical protein OESDEN_07880 [Oesophagostomum dentatum]|uniref:Uncharacterized protein n=1 Tax=Oesophagostomum dentatum TaxID=61180 RepID=A0A0B1T4T5_OESDE|nr:hypothetical protein OESDEN_07880 [Oesophagostomum dentatum]